jgi:purine catabolism regulator
VRNITVKDILASENMKGSKVVAGIAGLYREVRAVTVGEILDIGNCLHGADFVHTTAWFMREMPDDTEIGAWTREIIRHGAAALGIMTKRYIAAIPQIIIDIGNEMDFPIIELPFHLTQAMVNKEIINLITDYQTEILRRTQYALNYLMETMLNGQGLKNVAEILAKLLGNPVVIESATFKLLATAVTSEKSLEFMIARRNEEFLNFLRNRYCDIRLENIEGKSKKMLRDRYIKKLELSTETSSCFQITLPVLVRGNLYGFLSVLELENKLSEADFAILDQSNALIAMELYKQIFSFIAEERCRNEFLSLLLDDKQDNVQMISQGAHILGFNYKKPSLAIIVKFYWTKVTDLIAAHIIDQDMAQTITEILSQTDPDVFVAGRNGEIVIFYHPVHDEQSREVCQRILKAAKPMYYVKDMVIGIGRISNSLLSLRSSYKAASKATWIAEKFAMPDKIVDYRDLGFFRFLATDIRNNTEAVQFCYDVMGKLIEFDKKYHNNLQETLHMFLEENCSYINTAKMMHMHVHTVQYRIRKIKKMLFVDLEKMEGRANLWVALKIYQYIKNCEGKGDEFWREK